MRPTFSFVLKNLSGGSDKTVSWSTGVGTGTWTLATDQTVTLPAGKWQIVPASDSDALFPAGYTYEAAWVE
jgi:hypothetical protein